MKNEESVKLPPIPAMPGVGPTSKPAAPGPNVGQGDLKPDFGPTVMPPQPMPIIAPIPCYPIEPPKKV